MSVLAAFAAAAALLAAQSNTVAFMDESEQAALLANANCTTEDGVAEGFSGWSGAAPRLRNTAWMGAARYVFAYDVSAGGEASNLRPIMLAFPDGQPVMTGQQARTANRQLREQIARWRLTPADGARAQTGCLGWVDVSAR
jgi:hypothetical protein